MDLNDLLAEVEGIGEDRFIPSKSLTKATAATAAATPRQAEQPAAPVHEQKESASPSVPPTKESASSVPDEQSATAKNIPSAAPQPQSTLQVEQLFGMQPEAIPTEFGSLDMILDVELELTVELGKARIPLRDLLRFQPGNEFTLDTYHGNPLGIYVNERLVAHGEALLVDGSLAIKITELNSSSPDK